MTWTARANVKTIALFNSSESIDTKPPNFGSATTRDNCGCTSQLPRPMIRWRAVLSTLQDTHVIKQSATQFICKTLSWNKCKQPVITKWIFVTARSCYLASSTSLALVFIVYNLYWCCSQMLLTDILINARDSQSLPGLLEVPLGSITFIKSSIVRWTVTHLG